MKIQRLLTCDDADAGVSREVVDSCVWMGVDTRGGRKEQTKSGHKAGELASC